MLVVMIFFLLELGLLVLDGEVGTSSGLPLLADKVRDLLVLSLLNSGFVVLVEKSQYVSMSKQSGVCIPEGLDPRISLGQSRHLRLC